jgi:hypothetical protein
MSVLASGAIAPREAIEYVAGLGNIGTIVFGASSRGHIQETRAIILQALAKASQPAIARNEGTQAAAGRTSAVGEEG